MAKRHLVACGIVATLLAGCGDDVGGFENDGSNDGSNGGGPIGAGGGSWGGGASGDGASAPVPPPPISPPEEEPPSSCEGLDTTKPVEIYVSADDSNSMASPAHAREGLRSGQGYFGSVRTYEFLNYYRIDYPAPSVPGDLALFAEAAQGTEPGTIDLQFAVRSYDAPSARRPMTLTFSIDTSGSMEGSGIARARAAGLALASKLQRGDVVNVVTWSTEQLVILDNHAASGPNDSAVVAAFDALESNGGTDLNSGLARGYQLAMDTYDPERLNRLVFISDGGANVGQTTASVIAEHAELNDGEGIYLVGIGTGPVGSYSDELMDTVTDEGRGAYVYLDSTEEAQLILGDRFDEVMEVAARGVQVKLTMPWYFGIQKFYGEEYSENPDEVKPQHLAPSDAMVFLQQLKACDPEMIVLTDTVQVTATWQTPLTHQPREKHLETTVGALLDGPKTHLDKGAAIVAYAEALKTGDKTELSQALQRVMAANESGTDDELTEIAALIANHPAM